MNLYLISQEFNRGYDTFDSAVVAAESEEAARAISPSPYDESYSWCAPEHVAAKLIGVAIEGTQSGVICASFNAG